MTVTAVRTTLPLAGLIILSNIWMAAIYAHNLAAWGWVPGAGLAFWGVFFGLLGANNGLALVAFVGWAGALHREQAAAAELLTAVRWAGTPLRWRAHLWLDAPPSRVRPTPAWAWHLPYVAAFVAALALPACVAALLT